MHFDVVLSIYSSMLKKSEESSVDAAVCLRALRVCARFRCVCVCARSSCVCVHFRCVCVCALQMCVQCWQIGGGLPPNWASFDRLGSENNALGG